MKLSERTRGIGALTGLLILASAPVSATSYKIEAVAGIGGVNGFSGDGGPAIDAQFHQPRYIAVDADGNLYIGDHGNNRLRMVDTTGTVDTIVNGADYSGLTQLQGVAGIAADGNLYFANRAYPSAVWKWNAADSASELQWANLGHEYIFGIDMNAAGDKLYVPHQKHCVVYELDLYTESQTVVAGLPWSCGFSGDGGPATSARLNEPQNVALDSAGNLYIADVENAVVRRVDAATGIITTVAGTGLTGYSGDGGPATWAELNRPHGVDVDADGNLLIADTSNYRIRMVTGDGYIQTIAGNGSAGDSGDGGPATDAMVDVVYDVLALPDGEILIAGANNNRIRRLTPEPPLPSYGCVGFGPPMSSGPVTVRGHRALPLRAWLSDDEGFPVTDLDLAVSPVVQVVFLAASGGDPIDVSDDAYPVGWGTEGNIFEYNLTDQVWQFNLKTNNYTAAGRYTITMVSGDSSAYTLDPTCEAEFMVK